MSACPDCGIEVGTVYDLCPNCGFRFAPSTAPGPTPSLETTEEDRQVWPPGRPLGISILSVLLVLGGLASVYLGYVNFEALQSTITRVGPLNPYLGQLQELQAVFVLAVFIGLVQLLVAVGLWTGRWWSAPGFGFLVVSDAITLGVEFLILLTSPPGVQTDWAVLFGGAISTAFWWAIYLDYIRGPRVMHYLELLPKETTPPSQI